jgi:hypothetical protein
LTLLAAHKFGAKFFGTELNKRILAVAIERAAMKEFTMKNVMFSKNPKKSPSKRKTLFVSITDGIPISYYRQRTVIL